MNIFDAERYTISVRKEIVEGDELYVARVAELQDVEEYADSHAEAYALAIDTIETAHELCTEKGIAFPEPAVLDTSLVQASGRITLRMPKTLHANLATKAEQEGVSLNSFIVCELSASYSQQSICDKIKVNLGRIESSLIRFNDGFRTLKEVTSHHFFTVDVLEFPPTSNYTFTEKRLGRNEDAYY